MFGHGAVAGDPVVRRLEAQFKHVRGPTDGTVTPFSPRKKIKKI